MKSKGSKYEREFVNECDIAGLPAERRYGSQQCDDVRVAHQWRIECKYRANGTGFKSLYRWLGNNDHLIVRGDGVTLAVSRMSQWCHDRRLELDGDAEDFCSIGHKDSASSFETLRKWLGEADYLALRMPHHGWLVVEIKEDA